MRALGAALLALSGLLCGLLAAEGQRQALRRWEALRRMLELMEFELTRFRTPLPELMSSLSRQLEEPAAGLCAAAGSGLAERRSFSEAWSRALECLRPGEREVLAPLGSVLGRYGAEEQAAAAAACRRELEARIAQLRGELRERSRVYVGVGAAAGTVLGVLLL